jgi:hypothetical protein
VSYDLFLEGSDLDPFRALMLEVPNVRANDESTGSWTYANESTGVYFTMNVAHVIDEEEIAAGASTLPYVDCEINFLRPSFFMDEALPNVLDYASRLGLMVRDPQLHPDVAKAPEQVDRPAIREHWLAVTRSWVRREPDIPVMDAGAAARMWRHNLARDAIMDDPVKNCEGLFIPLIFAFAPVAEPRRVLTGITLGKNIASTIPPCDLAVLMDRRDVGGIEFGPYRTRYVRRADVLECLRPIFENGVDEPQPRIPPGEVVRAWKLLATILSEPANAYAKLAADEFVDVS